MLSKRREHREDLRKFLPLIETQRKKLELRKSLKEEKDMELINQQSDQLDDFKQQNEYQKTEIENYKKQLEEMTEEKKALIMQTMYMKMDISRMLEESEGFRNINQEYEQTITEMKEKEKLRKTFNERLGLMDYHKIGFFNEKNLEFTRNSSSIRDGLADRLYKKEIGDDDDCQPPLKYFYSLKSRRQQVIEFIDVARIYWNNYGLGTDIQKKIIVWLDSNSDQFLYEPSEEEKEKSRKMFLNKFKLQNTIGTIHFLPIQFSDCTRYFCFAISDYRIVSWDWNFSQQQAHPDLCERLKSKQKWTENSKFATEMAVNNKQSDTLIHTSKKYIFVENERVVTWIKNNFNVEQQRKEHLKCNYSIIPSLYNLFLNFYDASFLG